MAVIDAAALGRIARCHAYGDALGAPYEYDHAVRGPVFCPWAGHAAGTVTDDTEMALALAAGLAAGGGDAVERAYIELVDGGALPPCPFLGATVRAAYAGAGTPAVVARRRAEALRGAVTRAQSNGCLMRAWPLAARPLADAVADCARTNPGPICVYACAAYWALLTGRRVDVSLFDDAWAALPDDVVTMWDAVAVADDEAQAAVLDSASGALPADPRASTGWVLHALRFAFWAHGRAVAGEDAASVIARVVEAGGDVDTNAAVAGAAVGAAGGDVDVSALVRRDGAAIGPLLDAAVAGLLG